MKVSAANLKKYLSQRDSKSLINEIIELSRLFPVVSEYYFAKTNPDNVLIILEECKRKIKEGFFPKRGFAYPNFSKIKKNIADFKKVCNDPKHIGDLMVYYVECGVKFTEELGDIDEQFYISMAANYKKAFEFIVKHELYPEFSERLKTIVYKTYDMGWGFYEDLLEIYSTYSDEEL